MVLSDDLGTLTVPLLMKTLYHEARQVKVLDAALKRDYPRYGYLVILLHFCISGPFLVSLEYGNKV